MDPGEYWVCVEGSGYFVRFESHGARARWFTHRQMRRGYCFRTLEDARRVADQLKVYGRTATIKVERKVAPPLPPPPPPVMPNPVFGPPRRLQSWVDRILAESKGGDLKVGYRSLARRHHPDKGGKTTDMQLLSEAFTWLRANPQTDVPLEPETPFEDLFNAPPWEEPDPMPESVSELTDDDIPF